MDYYVDLALLEGEGVKEAEQVDHPHPENEHLGLRVAGQKGCCERKQGVEKTFLAVVFPPGLYPLGQAQVDRLCDMVLVVVVHFVGPDQSVLMIEDEEAEGHDDDDPKKEVIKHEVDPFRPAPSVGISHEEIEGEGRECEAAHELFDDRDGSVLLEDGNIGLGQ